MLPTPYVLLDLETTGAHPERDRIIEVALTRVTDSASPAERWETLINPEVPIPPVIERLVGISSAMVAEAPTFAEIAETLRAFLADAVLVAHNVRFDYGFLKQAFARCGIAFSVPLFCTVKFAKALEPEHRRHGLDALIERHGFSCPARHRARGDVAVLEQYLAFAQAHFPPERLLIAREAAMKHPARPPGLADGVIEAIPETAGVYLFFGENDLPLYIGKSKGLRSRVTAHFSAATRNATDAEIARQIRRIEWLETAGDLHAQLVEAELVQSMKPRYNKRLRHNQVAAAIHVAGLNAATRAPLTVTYLPIQGTDPRAWPAGTFGAFSNRKQAEQTLRQLAKNHGLCPVRLGWEPASRRACSAHQLRHCHGWCAGKESATEHDARLLAALQQLAPHPWPHDGPVLLPEANETGSRTVWFLVDQWCLLARFEREPTPDEIAAACAKPYRFDLDVFRILKAHGLAKLSVQ